MEPMTQAYFRAAGGGLKGISDTIGAYDQNRANMALARSQLAGTKAVQPMINDAWNAQNGYWGAFAGAAPEAFNNYMNAANDPYWTTDPQAFTYDKTVNDFIDPALNYRIDQGVRGLDASAAAQGNLFSSGHGRDVVAFGQDEASKEIQAATDRFNNSRAQAYSEFSNMLTERQNRRAQQANILGNVAGMGMQGLRNLSDARTNFDTSRINNTMDMYTAQGNYNAAKKANSNMMLRGGLNVLSGVASAVGG